MKNTSIYIASATLALALLASSANAACFADYKAKKSDPLKLHYGVVEIYDSSCESVDSVWNEVADRIYNGGWDLLNVMSVFNDDGLAERQDSAGQFFLRF